VHAIDPDPRTANMLGAFALAVTDRMYASLEAATGAGPSGAAALVALESWAAGSSVDDLRRILRLTHSGAVRLVDRLAEQGLVARERAAGDRRTVTLLLTARGRRIARRAAAARDASLRAALAGLSVDEQAVLTKVLERLIFQAVPDRVGARTFCRLCDADVCGHPSGCPATAAADAAAAAGSASTAA
jgi:DNA-binding MarR family transcriptional regulator